jgi:GNAT superfamily N-acetyltransferase
MHIQTLRFDTSPEYKRLFDELMTAVFGLNFQAWHAGGWWNSDYTCHSIVEEGQMLANASTYRMDLLIGGEKRTWLQIGAVATRPERRGQGLSRRLLEHILFQSPDVPMFLIANPSVLDFYPKFGFRRLLDRAPFIECDLPPSSAGLERLTAGGARVGEMLTRRACFSNVLDCANAAPIQFFHLLLEYPHSLYEIPSLGALLVAEQSANVLRLVDVCATRTVTMEDILPHLDFPGVDRIEFGFNPDWLGVECQWAESKKEDGIFVRGDLPLTGDFILPELLVT